MAAAARDRGGGEAGPAAGRTGSGGRSSPAQARRGVGQRQRAPLRPPARHRDVHARHPSRRARQGRGGDRRDGSGGRRARARRQPRQRPPRQGVARLRRALVGARPVPPRRAGAVPAVDARAEAWVPKACPTAAMARRIIGAAAELGFRPCSGIATVPLFVAGRVVATRGYQPGRGVFLDLPDGLPTIPEAPTRAEAAAGPGDAAAALPRLPRRAGRGGRAAERCGFAAGGLTAVLRPSLPAAPAVLVDGNSPASARARLARALAVMAPAGCRPS